MNDAFITDKLINKIIALSNPTAVGLDTSFDYLPERDRAACKSVEDAMKAVTDYNFALIERLSAYVPAVKVQVAYYEQYGICGLKAFADTLDMARRNGLITIADCKRNDIGSTAACYSAAYLGKVRVAGREYTPFAADFLTVNGYLGTDGLKPFIDDCARYDKGIFALVKTSNPSSGELQDCRFEDGEPLYMHMASLVAACGAQLVGGYGYSSVGAVVGATHPAQAAKIRAAFPTLFFLIPGYGAQGGSADGLTACFDERGLGGIVNNSRGILCAYRKEKYAGMSPVAAAEAAVLDMREDIGAALRKAGKEIRK